MATMSAALRRSYDWEANDNSWGPQNGDNADFTLVFENSILAILPAAFFLVILPMRLQYHWKKPKVATAGILFWARVTVTLAMLALEIAKSVTWCTRYHDSSLALLSSTSIAAAILDSISTLGVLMVVHAEYFHALYSSSFLGAHLSLCILFDATRTRSFWLRPSFETVSYLSLVITILKFVLVGLLETPKTLNLEREGNNKTPLFGEAKAGFWSRLTVFWVNSTLITGFKHQLTVAGLGILGPDYSAAEISAKFAPFWDAADQTSPNALAWASMKAFFWSFWAAGIPRGMQNAFKFMAPFVAQKVIVFLTDDNPPSYAAGGLVAASAMVYTGYTMFVTMEQYFMNRLGTKVRAALATLIIRKNLRLSHSKAKEAAAMTLITTDIEALVLSMQLIHALWTSIPSLAVGLYVLWTFIGKSFFVVTFPVFLSLGLSTYFGAYMGPATIAWNKAVQKRVAAMNVTLNHIKGLKMIGLDKVMATYGQGLRDYEVQVSKGVRNLRMWFNALAGIEYWGTATFLMLGGTVWTVWRDGIDNATVWPALAYLDLLTEPIFVLFNIYPQLTAMLGCFQRIQDFLNTAEHIDSRRLTQQSDDLHDDKEATTSTPAITLSNVSVRGKDEKNQVLKDLDFSISQSALCMVVGTVGTGKTVFLKTLIGETVIDVGTLDISTKYFAYCDQTAWMPDESIRNVVVGDCEYEEGRYREAVAVCSLSYDISQLPERDETLVGHNGASMSGGQKQRLALARAVYSLAPVVLCDDILSALDAVTSVAVFENVFGANGILKRQNRTAILATHSVQWLTSADQVIVMENGTAKPLYDEKAILEYSKTAVLSAHRGTTQDDDEAVQGRNDKLELEIAKAAQATRGSNPKLYSYMLHAVPRWQIIAFFCGFVLVALSERFPSIYVRIWVAVAPKSKLYLIGMAALWLVDMPVCYINGYVFQLIIAPIIASSLHRRFIEAVMAAKLTFITATSNGGLLNRFSQDMTLISQELPSAFVGAVYSFSFMFFSAIVILAAGQYSVIFIVIVLSGFYLIQLFYLKTSRQMRLLDIEAKTPLFTSLSETLSGIEHIRSYGWQEDVIERCIGYLDHSQVPFYFMMCIQRWLFLVLNCVGTLLSTGLTAMGVYLSKTTSQPSLGLALVGILHFSISASRFVQKWTLLETSLGAMARTKTFEEETPTENDEGTSPPPANWPANGVIEFINVSSKYSSEESSPMILKNISLKIGAGKKVVILGRTGSGKSTMILTLLNFLEMQGSITVDGLDISKVTHGELRKAITTIPQDSVEILGTVRDNLLPFSMLQRLEYTVSSGKFGTTKMIKNDATEWSTYRTEELETALTQVDLLAHVVKNGGLDTPMKDMHFSAGQKQLFNLARAILHKNDTGSRVVLMDEVTSNMDYETDVKIQEVMDKEFGDCTRIIISHRATGYTNCDMLVTMHEGKIVEVKDMHGEKVVISEDDTVLSEK